MVKKSLQTNGHTEWIPSHTLKKSGSLDAFQKCTIYISLKLPKASHNSLFTIYINRPRELCVYVLFSASCYLYFHSRKTSSRCSKQSVDIWMRDNTLAMPFHVCICIFSSGTFTCRSTHNLQCIIVQAWWQYDKYNICLNIPQQHMCKHITQLSVSVHYFLYIPFGNWYACCMCIMCTGCIVHFVCVKRKEAQVEGSNEWLAACKQK